MNYLEVIKKDLDTLMDISAGEYADLSPYLRIRSYEKNSFIIKEGQVEDHYRYLLSGIIGLFEKIEDKPVCRRLFTETDIAIDFVSYFFQAPSDFHLKAYTDCIVCELNRKDVDIIYRNFWKFSQLGSRLNQRCIVRELAWRKMLWNKPLETYNEFLRLFPKANMIKIKDISGVLNIPERTLNRLRGAK
ncbi:Crp/Fnr family transcriptional regulator [Negadavirga shengliensis]|uniref:Crp/Fnr family transcriptional regulator n=1 Tax=Negadavirga shengliensis TaxID=1389218 RepID=A0ABV9T988_9BACT